MRRRRHGGGSTSKYTIQDILLAFESPNPRKKRFGQYVIEDNKLLYEAQTSKDVLINTYSSEYDESFVKLSKELDDCSGWLTHDGKIVELESLSKDAPHRRLKLCFNETNLIAVKTKSGHLLGNAKTLSLVGRKVNYGHVDENTKETEIQKVMHLRHYLMLDLFDIECADETFETFNVVDNNTPSHGIVFTLNDGCHLSESNHNIVLLPQDVLTVQAAYECLQPDLVKQAYKANKNVKYNDEFYLVETTPPKLPQLTIDERLKILGHYRGYGLDSKTANYLLGGDITDPNDEEIEEEIKALMLKVPRPLTVTDKFGQPISVWGITLNGVTYARESGMWYQVIERLSVNLETPESDVNHVDQAS